jgi:glyoxylase-like metal-dependent hydrolase (beta-lactamase superfamily II)
VVTWQLPFKSPGGLPYVVTGYLDDSLRVERVECRINRPVLGDVTAEARFSEYTEAHGIRYPARIVQRLGGVPELELRIQGIATDSPEARRSLRKLSAGVLLPRARQELKAESEELATGVHVIRVGADTVSGNALAVEFNDHVLLFEPGRGSEAHARLTIAEARRLYPGKPIRYGVISHHHTGFIDGLPAVVAEGITIVTPRVNRAFLSAALNAPRTLAPDALALSARKPLIEGFRGDRRVFRDGTRTVEIHVLRDLPHAEGMVVAWLPDEAILAYVEVFGLWPSQVPRPGPTPANYQAFVDNLERLRLAPRILVPANGRVLHLTLDEIQRSLAGETVDFER